MGGGGAKTLLWGFVFAILFLIRHYPTFWFPFIYTKKQLRRHGMN